MMTDWTDRLSEYLDGTLSPSEVAACTEWLATHPEGEALLEELRRVVARAKTLPEAAVPDSLWAGIATAIRAERTQAPEMGRVVAFEPGRQQKPVTLGQRWSFTPLQFAAAATVVLGIGIAAGLGLRSRGTEGPIAVRPGRPIGVGVVTIPVVAQRAEVSYDKAVQELQVILDRNRASLDTSTVRVLEKSLASIDTALVEAQRALADDPHNAYLNDHLSRIKRKKLDLLRQGASLVQAS